MLIYILIYKPVNVLREDINILRSCNNLEIDGITWNDSNIGPDNSMIVQGQHIMFELAIPLVVNLGCKNVFLNGWVGGNNHGCFIQNEISFTENHLKNNIIDIECSKYLTNYLLLKFNVRIYTLSDSKYYINKINEQDFKKIVSN